MAFLLPGNSFAAVGGYIVSVAGKLAAIAVFIAAVGGKQKHGSAGEKFPLFGGGTCN